YGLYFRSSSAWITARSMNGRLLSTRQLRTAPSVVTTHFTIINPSTSRSRACGVYSGSGPESLTHLTCPSSSSSRCLGGGGGGGGAPRPPPTTPPGTPPSTPPSTPWSSGSSGFSGSAG